VGELKFCGLSFRVDQFMLESIEYTLPIWDAHSGYLGLTLMFCPGTSKFQLSFYLGVVDHV